MHTIDLCQACPIMRQQLVAMTGGPMQKSWKRDLRLALGAEPSGVLRCYFSALCEVAESRTRLFFQTKLMLQGVQRLLDLHVTYLL